MAKCTVQPGALIAALQQQQQQQQLLGAHFLMRRGSSGSGPAPAAPAEACTRSGTRALLLLLLLLLKAGWNGCNRGKPAQQYVMVKHAPAVQEQRVHCMHAAAATQQQQYSCTLAPCWHVRMNECPA
jgi:predicted Abi (CAAX) family protease